MLLFLKTTSAPLDCEYAVGRQSDSMTSKRARVFMASSDGDLQIILACRDDRVGDAAARGDHLDGRAVNQVFDQRRAFGSFIRRFHNDQARRALEAHHGFAYEDARDVALHRCGLLPATE